MHSQNLFRNLRTCIQTDCAENYVTEAFCWLLDSRREITRSFLQLVLGEVSVESDIAEAFWSTQVVLKDPMSRGRRPDMVCTCRDVVFIFENKIDELVDTAQLDGHRRLAEIRFGPKRIITVLIARDLGHHVGVADACISWSRIQEMLRRLQSVDPDSLTEQFIEFMGSEGLGRIPGPCPNYWKGNILEAKRRDRAFPNGYMDLGKKFGSVILPTSVEESLSDDVDGAARRLLESLIIVYESEDTTSAMWRFCRRFFPSYVKFTDRRWGTSLHIPEKKGRLFAEGVIDGIEIADFDITRDSLPELLSERG